MLRFAIAGAIALAALLPAGQAIARGRALPAMGCAAGEGWAACQAPENPPGLARRGLKRGGRHHGAAWRQGAGRASYAVGGLVAPLAAKVAELQAACGARLVSGVRHTLIAGTRRVSLHAQGKAADLAGNPGCLYARLAGWPGGVSIDYGRMRHVHVSYDAQGGREMGLRFAHGGGGHRRHGRHHHRLASR